MKISKERENLNKVKECIVYQFPQMKDKLFIEVIDVMKLLRDIFENEKK